MHGAWSFPFPVSVCLIKFVLFVNFLLSSEVTRVKEIISDRMFSSLLKTRNKRARSSSTVALRPGATLSHAFPCIAAMNTYDNSGFLSPCAMVRDFSRDGFYFFV